MLFQPKMFFLQRLWELIERCMQFSEDIAGTLTYFFHNIRVNRVCGGGHLIVRTQVTSSLGGGVRGSNKESRGDLV